MNVERLVTMANDIASFFAAEPDRQAGVDGVTNHLRRFWEPRMRKQIIAHLQAHDGAGLSELAREAVRRLAAAEPAR